MTGLSQRTKCSRSKGLESLSALIVMAGGIATCVTQNMVLAAAPLSVAVVLNLQNRRQMDRLTEYYAGLRRNTIQISLRQDLQAIQDYVSLLQRNSTESELAQFHQSIDALLGEIKRLEAQQKGGADAKKLPIFLDQIEDLKEQAQYCGQTLMGLMQDLQEISTPTARLAALKTILHRHQNIPRSIDQNPKVAELVRDWCGEVQSLQAQLDTLTSSMNPKNSSDLAASQGESLSCLYEQSSSLDHQLISIQKVLSEQLLPFNTDQQDLQRSLHQLREEMARLHHDLNSVKLSTSDMALSQIQIEEQIVTTLTPLQVQYVSLVNELELFEVDIQGLVYQACQLRHIHRQLLAIHQKMQWITQMDRD